MATEYRRVTFTNAELRSALERHFSKKGNGSIPNGDINAVRPTRTKGDIFYELTLFDDAKQEESTVLIEQDDIETALIDHCIETGILLPKLARKGIRHVYDNLCLEIFLE